MGYRSDVIVAFKNEVAKRFFNEISLKAATETLYGCEKHEKNGWIMLHYTDVKWYEDFPEVEAITKFMNSLRGTEDTDSYEFHRMGEETDDYEFRNQGCSPFDISLSRSLNFDV